MTIELSIPVDQNGEPLKNRSRLMIVKSVEYSDTTHDIEKAWHMAKGMNRRYYPGDYDREFPATFLFKRITEADKPELDHERFWYFEQICYPGFICEDIYGFKTIQQEVV